MQKGSFILEDALIDFEQAMKLQEQAPCHGDAIQLSQVMREDAMDAWDACILSDDTLSNLSVAEQINWRELPIKMIADLVIRYFGQRPDSGETLTQSFDKVVFQFSYEDGNIELQTIREYNIVASNFAQEREIPQEQQKDLVKLIEKRFPSNSQITADYLQMRQADDPGNAET